MVIERANQNIIIKLNETINMAAVQKLIDYINVLEISSQKQGTEEEAAALGMKLIKNGGRKTSTVLLNDCLSIRIYV
jgi:hypothetical protein